MDILKRSQEIYDEVVANRRYLHQNPEFGMELPNTVAFVKEKLTEMGYEPEDCGPSGIIATVGGRNGGKCILLRADMDSLPMAEESGLPFASINCKFAHTCGHDLHTAMLLGAAKILKEMEDELPGTVKLAFQPGEELLAGAKAMIQAGALENPHVDCALGMHVWSILPSGKISFAKGPAESSADALVIRIEGKGTHGSQPDKGIDPIVVAAHIIIALQELNAREVSPNETFVLTFGSLHSGVKNNILPDTAEIEGTLRTYDHQLRSDMLKRISEIVENIGKAYRAEAVLEVPYGCPPVVNDVQAMTTMGNGIEKVIGAENVDSKMEKIAGSDDFGFISEACPVSGYVLLGGNDGKQEEVYPQHHPKIYFDERTMINGVAAYVAAAQSWLEENK